MTHCEIVIEHTEYPCHNPSSTVRKILQLLDSHYTGTVTVIGSEFDKNDEERTLSKTFVQFGHWPFQSYTLDGRKPIRFRSAATADVIRKCINNEGEARLYL